MYIYIYIQGWNADVLHVYIYTQANPIMSYTYKQKDQKDAALQAYKYMLLCNDLWTHLRGSAQISFGRCFASTENVFLIYAQTSFREA